MILYDGKWDKLGWLCTSPEKGQLQMAVTTSDSHSCGGPIAFGGPKAGGHGPPQSILFMFSETPRAHGPTPARSDGPPFQPQGGRVPNVRSNRSFQEGQFCCPALQQEGKFSWAPSCKTAETQ